MTEPLTPEEARADAFWNSVKSDDQLSMARKKLSFHELRLIYQHAVRAGASEKMARAVTDLLTAYDAENWLRTADFHAIDCGCLRCAVARLRSLMEKK